MSGPEDVLDLGEIVMKKRKSCVYCGSTKSLGRDHVPPKCLFPTPRSQDMITVPACEKCNSEASKDDEYFRRALVMRYDSGDHPDAKRLWQTKVLPSLKRPDKQGFTASLYRDIRKSSVHTSDGIYLGKAMSYKVDFTRFSNVVDRIIKGLHYHHTGIPCIEPWRIRTWFTEFIDLDDASARECLQPIVSAVLSEDAHVIGNNVFIYRYMRAPDKPDNASVWLLQFYENVEVLGVALLEPLPT